MASIQRHSGLKAAPISPIAPEPEPEPEPIRFSEPPPAAEPVLPPVPVETNFIPVSLSDLAQAWPDAIRQEIHSRNIGHMQVGLPFGAVEGAIKQGKVSFPWKAVRSWIKPPLPPSNSPLDTAMLELPLRVVTPLFMAELKATRSQRSRVAIDKEIPDLFYGAGGAPEPAAPVAPIAPLKPQFPTPSATTLGLPNSAGPAHPPGHGPLTQRPGPGISPEAAKAAKLADTNYYTWKDDNDEVDGSEVFTKKGENSPGTAFLNRYATPNDIVGKAAGLKGVDGALIALPDGLLVASRIPPNMNADTIAAFLPQIFSRVSQSTRELRLGELNNLNFTVGNIPWKIFRVGSIYFAVFGRPGEPLPTSQLVSLAAELDRKAK
jgi:predicted regulator of Ras-like GTPase activity (Roadblock/LC7/MglB family)